MLTDKAYTILCEQLRKQDESCIATIYTHYAEALYGIIVRIVSNTEDANEVLQDTFVKVWEKGSTYDPAYGRLFTWMATIARNLAINKRNSKANIQRSKIQSDEKLVYLDNGSNPMLRQEALDIKGMLTRLDNKYALIISKLYFEGYTQAELSKDMNIPLGTIKSRVKIGLRELRKLYDFGVATAILTALAKVDISA